MNQNFIQGLKTTLTTHRRWAMIFMLVMLHGSLLLERTNLLFQTLLLAHFGLFLLWQPIWRGERRLTPTSTSLIAGACLLFTLWNNWWLIALWIALLIGLIGGLVFATPKRAPRWFYLTAELYLIGALLVWVVPHLLPGEAVPQAARSIMQAGLPLFLLIMPMIPARDEPRQLQSIDFFYSLLLFLLMVALVLGSFALKVESHGDYLTALASSLFIIALALVALSWAWNPRGGFAGLEQVFSRYLLSIGLPFEQWLHRLARLAESETDPALFLTQAMRALTEVPGITGGSWQAPENSGQFGESAASRADFNFPQLSLVLYAKSPFSPAMLLHLNLLVQLVEVFYQSKRREQILEQQAYLQAVHETGARLTHDVKNLLQSLKGLCAAAGQEPSGNNCTLQSLFARQLPRITQRLEQTLEKLHHPSSEVDTTQIDAQTWWEGLRQRYAHENVAFTQQGNFLDVRIPGELFDNVTDNLLQNALEKRKLENRLNIAVSFDHEEALTLRVCDDGFPIENLLAVKLFTAPVASRNGLGIGLYQASSFAKRLGYRLQLTSNEAGKVCFELRAQTKSIA